MKGPGLGSRLDKDAGGGPVQQREEAPSELSWGPNTPLRVLSSSSSPDPPQGVTTLALARSEEFCIGNVSCL